MSEILQNTGAKLWSIVDDHDELQTDVFEELVGTGGKSDIRLIDEAIGKINKKLNGYYFSYENNRLYICKDNDTSTTKLPVSLVDNNGNIASTIDGTTITIDKDGIVHGTTIDESFSLTSTNPVQNKVVKAKFDEIEEKVNANETTILSHKNDQNNPHNVTKSQLNLGNVEDKSSETIRSEITKENVTTALGYTPYTPNEVDNKFSTLETNIDWKEAVDTFTDIAVTYPSPEDGWTVNTKDNNITYRYNGSEWVAISANAIPKATNSVDGLLSKEDHTKYDDAASKAHTHSNKDLLDKLGESTEGNLTFNGDEINAAQMTGATADKDGTSGTVPAPKSGQENLFLRGDGTWADLSSYYNNANYSDNKLQLMHNDTILKEFEIKSGGTSIAPKATVDPAIVSGNAKVTITWGDPDDSIIDGVVLSTWAGTKLVMKEDGYPENENDGTVIIDNTVKDAYKTSGYVVDNLTNGNTYYFALFPYSTDGIYNYQASNRLLGKPSLVRLDPCTDMSIASAMGSATVKWTDPEATKTVDGNTATWAKTVLVYKEGATAPSSPSDGTVAVEETTRNQYQTDGYKVNGLTDGKQYTFALFAISTENSASDSTSSSVKLWSTIAISTEETSLYGKDITVSYGENNMTATFDSSGSATVDVPYIGDVTISSTDGSDTANSNVTISAYGNTYSAELSFLKIVTFADGTDEEIAAMMQAHYDNKINISDYWAVGDKRSVNLSAMSATYVGESHRAQTIEYAIADFGKDELSTPINGHTMAAITLTQVNCLMDATSASNSNNGSSDTERGYMNSSDTNVGGWTDCARRKWCNEVYYNALPSVFRSMVKEVNKKTSAGNQSSTINTTKDKAFLLSESEIYGSTTYSKAGEGSQYEYYKTTANRYKLPKWSSSSNSHAYWDRSPHGSSSSSFCRVGSNGNAFYANASDSRGFAPCLCI